MDEILKLPELPTGRAYVFIAENNKHLGVLEEYGIISGTLIDNYYTTEQHSTKYLAYKFDDEGTVYGIKTFDDKTYWTQLKTFTFLSSRSEYAESILGIMSDTNSISDNVEFEIDESLVHGYNNTNVDSCMKGNGEYFANFEGAGVLLQLVGETNGRAIIWSDSYISGLPDGCQGLMDRIYPSDNHKIVNVFKDYANKHNLMYKKRQNYSDKDNFIFNGNEVNCRLSLSPPEVQSSDYYPYIDTFSFTDNLRNFHNKSDGCDTKLDDTDGGTGSVHVCCSCDYCIDNEDDRYYGPDGDDMYCSDCFHEVYTTCERCCDAFEHDNIHEVSYGSLCEDCLEIKGYVYCTDINDYSDDYVHVYDKDEFVHSRFGLIQTEDTERYFESADGLFFTVDTEVYFESSKNLFLTEDTGSYFEDNAGLYSHDGLWYENEVEEDEDCT